MSNRICGRCKSSVVVPWNNVKDFYKCMNCSAMGYAEKFPEKTVFQQITASEEVLAPKFVYEAAIRTSKLVYDQRGRGVGVGYDIEEVWKSTITEDTYISEAEAIAATLAKLKEVVK